MSKINFKYSNGDLLRCKVTGLEGVVMVCALYSTGCKHYGLLPRKLKKDGSPSSWTWLDQSQVDKIKTNAVAFDIKEGSVSGPMPSGPQL
jgi:hypothetical protein